VASLGRYCRVERLDASFICKACDAAGTSSRQMSLHNLPAILCIHLKRFETTRQGGRKKIGTPMEFLAELDLRPFTKWEAPPNPDAMEVEQAEGPLLYELRGVVNHSGAIDNGHYTAFVHLPALQTWIKCDDHKVFHATRPEVFQSQAYLLFYQRISH